MKKLAAVLLLILICRVLPAQEMLGVINSNYAGIYNIRLNPSLTQSSRLYADFNLVSAQSFFDNNYAYFSNNDFYNIVFKKQFPEYFTYEDEQRYYTINRSVKDKKGYENTTITGPGAMLVYGKHAFGLTTALRSVSSFSNLPIDMANFLYEAIDFDRQHGINYKHDKDIKIASLSWFELGINYAYVLRRYKWDYLSAGITVKPLLGVSGLYTLIDYVDYTVHSDTTATVYDATFEYGFSLPVNYSSYAYKPSPPVRGYGFSTDLGLTYMYTTKGHRSYVFTRLCEQQYEDYNFRLGLSILDLGFIKFSKKVVSKSFENTSTEWFRVYDTLPTSSLNEIAYKIDNYFFNNNGEQVVSNDNFILALPLTISLQADVWAGRNFYINLSQFYPVRIFKRDFFHRPSIIAVTPRYETARFEIALPFSLYDFDFSMPRFGLSFRYGNFFAGVDRLNSYLGLSNFTGADFYAGLRMNLSNVMKLNFIKGVCGMRKMYNIETFDYRNF